MKRFSDFARVVQKSRKSKSHRIAAGITIGVGCNYFITTEKGKSDMGIWESAMTLVIAIVSGSAGAAVVNAINDRWKFKAARKAKQEDDADEQAEKTEELEDAVAEVKKAEEELKETHKKDMQTLEAQMNAQSEALKLMLLDRILTLGQEFIEQGEITFDNRKRFHAMHDCYHDGLGGNGDAKFVVADVDKLPLKM